MLYNHHLCAFCHKAAHIPVIVFSMFNVIVHKILCNFNCLTVGYVTCIQITSRRSGSSEFIAHSLSHLHSLQFHKYCHPQYHNYFSCCSHFPALDTTQLVAAGLPLHSATAWLHLICLASQSTHCPHCSAGLLYCSQLPCSNRGVPCYITLGSAVTSLFTGLLP
jgi:hypothetical protein